MAVVAARLATYADLEGVPDTLVAEIIDGAVETHPRPRPRHARAAGRLSTRLSTRFEDGDDGPGGWIFIVEPELHLGAHVVVPDIAGWRSERLAREPDEAFITVPPDWVCEVLSPSTAKVDRGPKRRIYAEAGVGYLWLLDPVAGELEAFSLAGSHWLLQATIQRGEAVSVPPFDAVSFPLDDLFPFDTPPSTEA